MAKPPTCAELDTTAQLMDLRVVRIEAVADKTEDRVTTLEKHVEGRFARYETENATLKASNERLENRLWLMTFTSLFAVFTALVSVGTMFVKASK